MPNSLTGLLLIRVWWYGGHRVWLTGRQDPMPNSPTGLLLPRVWWYGGHRVRLTWRQDPIPNSLTGLLLPGRCLKALLKKNTIVERGYIFTYNFFLLHFIVCGLTLYHLTTKLKYCLYLTVTDPKHGLIPPHTNRNTYKNAERGKITCVFVLDIPPRAE